MREPIPDPSMERMALPSRWNQEGRSGTGLYTKLLWPMFLSHPISLSFADLTCGARGTAG